MTAHEVSWELDGITMYGTLVRPDGAGPFPAVVLVAGSGPTDRDWCSPLLAGSNGSGRLLADALAEAGIASLRYDKRASGPHAAENVPQLIGKLSMQSHLDELVAAVATLAAQEYVDASRIVGLGNSEGTLHVLHYAITPQDVAFAGLVLAAPPGRPPRDILLAQLALQATQLPNGDELMDLVRAATDRYEAGRPMEADPQLPEQVRMVLASFETPANLPLARELWSEAATRSLSEVKIPTLVLIGAHDLQVDLHADGEPLQAAAAGMPNISFAFPPNANHVLKHETRTAAEVIATPGNGYNADGTRLDPEALQTILSWFRTAVSGSRRS
ncbi:alpha/beta hydrolase family protein [Kribbella sp. NPDC051586]|uniref:alpha/beta hydrolase family protein n=1 Tax=Kribbella sp. NPDC051586 TaxID=3364118 RepID=UPI0037BE1007